MTLDKTFPDARAALHDVRDGMTILCGGFGLCGIPEDFSTPPEIARLGAREG